jgi:hypothetical protein
MDRSITAAGLATGVLWGGALLSVGLMNLVQPSYGKPFLKLVRSIYPGLSAKNSAPTVALLTAYGFADGFVSGVFFAMLYRAFGGGVERAPATQAAMQPGAGSLSNPQES